MKIKVAFLIISLTIISGICFAQQVNNKIDEITFRFEHSRRIKNNKVVIGIIKRESETEVSVTTMSMDYAEQNKWKKPDTSFLIQTKTFIELANQVSTLSKINLNKAFEGGNDGTECSIEFGTFGSTVTYKFWTPEYETNQRGLSEFLILCKKIIIIGKLKPEEIL